MKNRVALIFGPVEYEIYKVQNGVHIPNKLELKFYLIFQIKNNTHQSILN